MVLSVATPRFGTRRGNLQITSEDPCRLPLPLNSPIMFTLDILAPTKVHQLDLSWEHDPALFTNLCCMIRTQLGVLLSSGHVKKMSL